MVTVENKSELTSKKVRKLKRANQDIRFRISILTI